MPINWKRFTEIIHQHQSFILTSHVRPDCDALGSELGMAGILDALGKDVVIVNGQETPPNIAFIDPTSRIRVIHQTMKPSEMEGRDVVMILDTSAWAQLGPMGDFVRNTSARKIIVDHHVSEDDLGAEAFKNTSAEAAGRLVVEAAEQLGVEITAEIATPLFAAIATDTGWFRFPSTSSETYRIAARLMDAGAAPQTIYRNLYECDTLGRLRLRGIILSRLQTELDGRLVHTFVRWDDFAQAGAIPPDTEDAINLSLTIEGTEAAVILVEQEGGGFKISFRSRCEMDCSRVAQQFDGGGHKAAAGAFVNESFEVAQQLVLDAVRAAMP